AAGKDLSHGCEAQRPLPARPLLRRLGHAVAADALSEDLRRHLVHLARPKRLPRLHRRGLVRAARERLRKSDGTPYPLVRDKGKVLATFQQFAQLERVLGPYGGQMASFEWVFSPKGKD